MSKSPYSDLSQKVRMTYRQFEVFNILPLVDFDGADVFASPSKKTVYLEFDHFVQFLATNLNEEHLLLDYSLTEILPARFTVEREQNLISVVREGTHDKAIIVENIISTLFDTIKKHVAKGSKKLSPSDVYKSLNQTQKTHFDVNFKRHRVSIAELWSQFLVHTAIMNIKSVIACGEYYNTKMRNRVNVVPMLFIPRLGIMQSLFSDTTQTIDSIQEKVITNTPNEYSIPTITGTLDKSAIDDIYNLKVSSDLEYDEFLIASVFSLTEERYNTAWDNIISSSSYVESHIEECENYMFHFNNVLDFISRLATLTEHFNKKERLFLVDVPML